MAGFRCCTQEGPCDRREEILFGGLDTRLSYFYVLEYLVTQDLKREFVTDLIYPAVQANCIYEVCYYSL